jgi:glutathione synthase/RimK-type ligase-like ATP-grasp enzyme
LDVVRNGDGKLLLIELNAAPQFIKFVEDNWPSEVIWLYKKIILDLD